MKQKMWNVVKRKYMFFIIMFESIILGSVIAAMEIGDNTMDSALFLRKIYLKEALKVGISLGIIIEAIMFIIFLLYEIKKKK